MPDGLEIKYNKRTAKKVRRYIKNTDSKILFVYGGWDPWSATAFEVPKKDNFLKIVKPGGSHSTRFNNLPLEQNKLVKEMLEGWLDIEVNIKMEE